MPTHSILNRQGPHLRKVVFLTADANLGLEKKAKALKISQGSLADIAIRTLLDKPNKEIVELLYKNGHLTDEAHQYLLNYIKEITK